MGTYTPEERYYLIDSSEFVDVDQDINYNWDRADTRLKPLLTYQVTDEPSISQSPDLVLDPGFKWFKRYTNSIWVMDAERFIRQDPNSQIDLWSTSGISFESGYSQQDSTNNQVAYSTFNNFVRFRGAVWLNGGASDFPLNTDTKFMTVPTSILPLRNKYIMVYGGDATSDFCIFRIFIPAAGNADKRISFIKMGGAASAASQRFFNLNDVYYGLDT